MKKRLVSALLTFTLLVPACCAGTTAAFAQSKSRENAWRIGTYVLGAGTIAALAKGKGTLALIGGGATLLSYTQWRKEMRKRHRRADMRAYRAYRTRWLRQHRGRRVRAR